MHDIIQLIRLKDWVKNFVIVLPILFSKNFFDLEKSLDVFFLFIIFCFASSIVYIFNDIIDCKDDKLNDLKIKIKPLARGSLSFKFSFSFIFFLVILLAFLLFYNQVIIFHIFLFFISNFFYNLLFKKIPFFDLLIISLGYIIRLDAGSKIIEVESSLLMIITVFSLSFFVISMKRYIEFNNNVPKESIKKYKKSILNLFILISLLFSLIFYSLFIYFKHIDLLITLPFSIFFLIRYYFKYKNKTILLPFDIIFNDYKLYTCIIVYFVLIFFIIY